MLQVPHVQILNTFIVEHFIHIHILVCVCVYRVITFIFMVIGYWRFCQIDKCIRQNCLLLVHSSHMWIWQCIGIISKCWVCQKPLVKIACVFYIPMWPYHESKIFGFQKNCYLKSFSIKHLIGNYPCTIMLSTGCRK